MQNVDRITFFSLSSQFCWIIVQLHKIILAVLLTQHNTQIPLFWPCSGGLWEEHEGCQVSRLTGRMLLTSVTDSSDLIWLLITPSYSIRAVHTSVPQLKVLRHATKYLEHYTHPWCCVQATSELSLRLSGNILAKRLTLIISILNLLLLNH